MPGEGEPAVVINGTYEVIKKLGKGVQGVTWLVRHITENKNYALKKVECNDHDEAGKALVQAQALQQLDHPYVAKYTDFFVDWDPVDEAVYVCIVSEFYETGELATVLKNQRSKETALPEAIMKKWLGQMVDAMHFLHTKCGVVHRDLKPTNIYMSKELNIVLGDFGVQSVMDDCKKRSRTLVGALGWMAPEALTKSFDDRSDVWSLGAVILDAACCAFTDTKEGHDNLMHVRKANTSSANLQAKLLADIDSYFSRELSQVLVAMLEPNHKERLSMDTLSQLPFIRQCLMLAKSRLVMNPNGDTASPLLLTVPKPMTTKRIPDTVLEVIEFFKEHGKRVACVVRGLEQIKTMFSGRIKVDGTKAVHLIDDVGKRFMISMMETNKDNLWVQTAGIEALHAISMQESDPNDIIFSLEIIAPVLTIMRYYPSVDGLQEASVRLLISLLESEACCKIVAEEGGINQIQTILNNMELQADDVPEAKKNTMATLCLKVHYTVGIVVGGSSIENKGMVVRNICYWAKECATHAEAVKYALGALWGVSDDDECYAHMIEQDAPALVFQALDTFMDNKDVVRHGCDLLCALIADEGIAHAIGNTDESRGQTNFFPILRRVCDHYMPLKPEDVTEVLSSIFKLLTSMVDHEDMLEHVIIQQFIETLTRAKYALDSERRPSATVARRATEFLLRVQDFGTPRGSQVGDADMDADADMEGGEQRAGASAEVLVSR